MPDHSAGRGADAPAVVGEMEMLSGEARMASVTAMGAVKVRSVVVASRRRRSGSRLVVAVVVVVAVASRRVVVLVCAIIALVLASVDLVVAAPVLQ